MASAADAPTAAAGRTAGPAAKLRPSPALALHPAGLEALLAAAAAIPGPAAPLFAVSAPAPRARDRRRRAAPASSARPDGAHVPLRYREWEKPMQTTTLGDVVTEPGPGRLLATPTAMAQHTPAGVVGNTPLLWIGEPFCGPGQGFWAKLEGHNPGGIKDRPALHMVQQARRRGRLAPKSMIVESTSGTLGLGLALAGISFGHPVAVVTDPGMEPLMQRLLTAYGAAVHIVTEAHPVGGWQQARRDRVGELLAEEPGAYCPDQYNNPDNVDAYASLAHELIAQLGRIDTLVASVGTGGHSAGVFRELRRFLPDLTLVGVDTVGSTIFGQPAGTRLMRGLGSSIHPRNVDYAAFSEVH